MKHYLVFCLLFGTLLLGSCGSTRVVATRPADVIYTRPASPGSGYVWINGDWYWRGGRYEWQQGRWDRGRLGHNWNEGTWRQSRRGWRWNRGHWR
ncbi:MAG: YXWGXW repeat-containing protein [Chitinophagaceae bacterium]